MKRNWKTSWKIAVLMGIVPTLAWACGETRQPRGHGTSSHATEAPAAPSTVPTATETPESSPFDGHYERKGTGENTAALDILQVGPGLIRIKGLALWVGNAETGDVHTGDLSGTAPLERLKAHFKNADDCKLDVLFHADGLKVENTAMACGGLNVTFDGEYARTGPPEFRRDPGGH
jgi:hypothetical protein